MTKKSAANDAADATSPRASACAMGKIYRFIEPAVLMLLAEHGDAHGYELHERLGECALTESTVDRAALYRSLRALESNGHVVSCWNRGDCAPARRVYHLTSAGRRHLSEWSALLGRLGEAMGQFVAREKALPKQGRAAEPKF